MFRRLAREAVIFALLGMVLASIGSFVYMDYNDSKSIQARRDELKKECDVLAKGGWDYDVTIADERMTTRSECNLVFGTTLPSLSPPPSTPDFLAKENSALAEGTRIKNRKVDDPSNAIIAAVIGLWGFPGGFGVWLFYRLVRFAIKG